jgi:hypothetical protein
MNKVVEAEVFTVYQQPTSQPGEETFVVVLKAKNSNKILPIWIGKNEAQAIYLALKDIKYERPLTHDLIKSLFDALEVEVPKIVINALVNNTYYARLLLKDKEGNIYSVDARPSDSIAIALRMKSKIFVAEDIMERGEEIDLDALK